jgi:hypothetical protein
MARIDLGLSLSEFGATTPGTFHEMLTRKQAAHKRACFYSGIVAAAVYNANPYRSKNAEPVSPVDFMPSEGRKSMSLAEQIRVVAAALKCGPGVKGKKKTAGRQIGR